ncbi:MAG: hypothetical protein FWD48_09235 [Oscillospiraceae bacterium]|nr:hypothetical protein [Oscillospiraceae bacterium]
MKNKRQWLLISIGIIGSILLFIIDYQERGLVLSAFGFPALILGTVIIPNIIDIKKKK